MLRTSVAEENGCMLWPLRVCNFNIGSIAGAMEVKRDLEQATGLELPPTLVFDYPSMTELAGFLLQQLPPTASMPVPAVSQAASAQQQVQASQTKDREVMQAAAGEAAQPSTASAAVGPAWRPMTHVQRVAYFKQQVILNKLCRTCCWQTSMMNACLMSPGRSEGQADFEVGQCL